MAKLVALLATLLVVAHVAAAYHTTITTVETTETDNPGRRGMGGCQEEMGQRDMRPCMDYMMQQQQRQGGGRRGGEGGRDMYRNMCCQELKRFQDERCMCDALMMEMQQMMGTRPEMMREMMSTAEELPRMCGAMHDRCHFQSRWM